VLLPTEHGGWGLLIEPLVLGLVVAPSLAGALLALAAFGAFLARHPLRLVLFDRRRGSWHPRTRFALLAAIVYLVASTLAVLAGLALAEASIAACALAAFPAVAVYLAYDLRGRSREAIAEVAGAFGLAATATAVALAAGWPASRAFGLWFLAGGRALAAVVEVRTRLRRSRRPETPALPAVAAHGVAIAAVAGCAALGWVPAGVVAVGLLLLARAVWNLWGKTGPLVPREIGWAEMRMGAAATVAWVAAYAMEAWR
jgi:hypothetical protein